MRLPLCLLTMLVLLPAVCWAQAKLPLTFDTDPGWLQRPHFLANPTTQVQVSVADGANTLQVNEMGKGMKFEVPLQSFDSGYYPYLVVRYKAENLGLGGYSLWAFDGSREGIEVINPRDLTADGQWHAIAVDLALRGVVGAVRSLVVEVQCAKAPAYLSLDAITLQDEVSEHTKIVPEAPPEGQEMLIKVIDLPQPQAEPDWLAADAPRYGMDVQEQALHLWAEGQDVGMKFSTKLREPLDLSPYRFAAVRYRAKGTAPWGDYAVWLGSGGGGMPDEYARVMELHHLRNDGEWHVGIMPVLATFKAVDMALQVSTAETRGDVWIESIRFTTKRPLLEMADVLPYRAGWDGGTLTHFRTVDIGPLVNASAEAKLRANGLSSWFAMAPQASASKITVRGIPFVVLGGARNVLQTPPDIEQTATVPVGGKAAGEAYLLMLGRLPSVDACRMGDPAPMDSFRNPERFRVRVEYSDGVVDEMFPLACGSGQFEVTRGPDVYCLTGLRREPIKSLGLVNRMDSGSFLLVGVTLNEGKAVTVAPKVQEQSPPVRPLSTVGPLPTPQIKPIAGGFFIQSHSGSLTLTTTQGLRLEKLVPAYSNTSVIEPGPLFEIGEGKTLVDSTQVTVGAPKLAGKTLTIPVDGSAQGVPLAGQLVIALDDEKATMRLDLASTSDAVTKPIVNFPVVKGVKFGAPAGMWYMYAKKGGVVSSRNTQQRAAYGGQYPLQVADAFDPAAGRGLALCTYDLDDLYRYWFMEKSERGVDWKMEYWVREVQPGEKVETAPTALVPHFGDWRTALSMYQQWTKTWFKPMVPRKRWFQEVFYYQQTLAWSELRDTSGKWIMSERIKRYKDAFGCLDYLHVFDFGDSRVYGRVGDYNHYDELGGLAAMRAAFKEAQDHGVRMGVYIEGYLCDNRGIWGKPNVPANCIRLQDGKPLMWTGSNSETMMCAAAQPWRQHLAETYKRVADELQPDGMYIDQYGFIDTWKTCWSREHGHPVPAAPIRGEGGTTQAIRAAMPPQTANLTEETPNDVHARYQDGALGYSVVSTDPNLAPHRVDLFRFVFPDFKVFQVVSYNPFIEGGWDLLKWPFLNGEAIWLQQDPVRDYCSDARAFLKQSFAILHRYKDAFCSHEVSPLVPTLKPTVYANEFRGPKATAWTLFNAEFRTLRGDLLSVPHRASARYVDAFTGRDIKPRTVRGRDVLAVTVGPRDVGCVVAEYK